ncbi:MAG: hypothetical protein ABI026_00685 [Gemmatimonadaceae bacterium]
MRSIPRIHPVGGTVLCLLLAAAAIPAFARDSSSHPGSAHGTPVRVPAPKVALSSREGINMVPIAERADTNTGFSGAVRVHILSPGSAPPGVYDVPSGVAGHSFAFIGIVPFSAKLGEFVGTYHMGYWPAELHGARSEAYDNPAGFVEVTEANAGVHVSDHLTLGDFVTHDGAPFPKYVVLREALLDKIELVLNDLEAHGVPTEHIRILSGFRTPSYNFALGDASGRARESRHQYGDAVDMIVDANHDGRMDDLNNDGRTDVADVRVIESAVDRVERAHPELAGGLGLYREMGPSGPFAHIDVRGTRARWGTASRPIYASAASRAASTRSDHPLSSGHCEAEGASAVLCQGFRHSR